MLIAQMFHIEGHPPDAVLTWALGALAAGVILQSNPALALAMLLICLWSGWETTDGGGEVHWAFLLGWGAVTGRHRLAALGAPGCISPPSPCRSGSSASAISCSTATGTASSSASGC